MNNTWVIGDIHGAYKALLQIMDRAPLKEGDTIIVLGDIVDGWSESFECVEYFIQNKDKYNWVFIRGNHDSWFLDYLKMGYSPIGWEQGSRATIDSYIRNLKEEDTFKLLSFIPKEHFQFFENQVPYKVIDNNLFIHGGFNRHYLLQDQTEFIFMWDRDLWYAAMSFGIMEEDSEHFLRPKLKIKENFKEIFIGHTTTLQFKESVPMNRANIWNLDTGAGFNGKLTIMNVDTKEFYQSDLVKELYSEESGRNN